MAAPLDAGGREERGWFNLKYQFLGDVSKWVHEVSQPLGLKRWIPVATLTPGPPVVPPVPWDAKPLFVRRWYRDSLL